MHSCICYCYYLQIPSQVSSIPNPLNPSIHLTGLIPSTATMFRSAVYPCVIDFECAPASPRHTTAPAPGSYLFRAASTNMSFRDTSNLRSSGAETGRGSIIGAITGLG